MPGPAAVPSVPWAPSSLHTHTDRHAPRWSGQTLSTRQLSCCGSPVRQDKCKAAEQPRLPAPPWPAWFSPGSLNRRITNACSQQGLTAGELICTMLFALNPVSDFSGSESTAQAAVAKSQNLELSWDQPLSLRLCRAMCSE